MSLNWVVPGPCRVSGLYLLSCTDDDLPSLVFAVMLARNRGGGKEELHKRPKNSLRALRPSSLPFVERGCKPPRRSQTTLIQKARGAARSGAGFATCKEDGIGPKTLSMKSSGGGGRRSRAMTSSPRNRWPPQNSRIARDPCGVPSHPQGATEPLRTPKAAAPVVISAPKGQKTRKRLLCQ